MSQLGEKVLLTTRGFETRDSAKHPTTHRIALTPKSYPAHNAGSAKVVRLFFTFARFPTPENKQFKIICVKNHLGYL